MNKDYLDYEICKQITRSSDQLEMRMYLENKRLKELERRHKENINLLWLSLIVFIMYVVVVNILY